MLVSAPDTFYTLPMRMRRERGGAGKKGSGDTARRILECKLFHSWSNTVYTISDNCTHVTEYVVQAAVNSKDLGHARCLGVYRSLYE